MQINRSELTILAANRSERPHWDAKHNIECANDRRHEISSQIDRFLSSGGKITEIALGVSGHNVPFNRPPICRIPKDKPKSVERRHAAAKSKLS